MKKEDLMNLTVKELTEKATKLGVTGITSKTKKEDIANMMIAKDAENRSNNVVPNESYQLNGKDDAKVQSVDDLLNKTTGDTANSEVATGQDNTATVTDEQFEQGYPQGQENPDGNTQNPPENKQEGQNNDKGKDNDIPNDIVDLTKVPTTMIPITQLVPSDKNFFKPLSEKKFKELTESIRGNGVLVPLIVRPVSTTGAKTFYEILAGHNRVKVAESLRIKEVPARIVEVSDEKAEEIIIDTNVAQRQELTPMEIAKAYAKKKEILGNRQGKRTDITGKDGKPATDAEKQGTTRDIIAQEYGKSGMTIERFLRLNNLIPELQDAIDNGAVAPKAGFELGLIDVPTQNIIAKAVKGKENSLSTSKVKDIRHLIKERKEALGEEKVKEFVNTGVVTVDDVKKVISGEITPNTNNVDVYKLTISIPVSDEYATKNEDFKEWVEGNIVGQEEWIVEKLIKGYYEGKVKIVK